MKINYTITGYCTITYFEKSKEITTRLTIDLFHALVLLSKKEEINSQFAIDENHFLEILDMNVFI